MTGFGDCCLKGIVKADTSSRGEKNDNESRTVLRVILFIFVAYIFNTWIFVFVMIYLFVRRVLNKKQPKAVIDFPRCHLVVLMFKKTLDKIPFSSR